MLWRFLCVASLAAAAAAAAAATAAVGAKERFDGFRVYRVVPTTQEQLHFLQDLEEQTSNFNFWSPPVLNATVDVMVSPYLRIDFRDLARAVGLNANVLIQDVQKLIDEENPRERATGDFGWKAYYPLSEVEAWLDSLAEKYKDIVEVIEVGETTEKRKIKGVKISKRANNPVIFVESGIHAREWITVATATYLINKLLTSTDPSIEKLAEEYDWYIVPSTNPDGYEYSYYKNRLWRKTRSKNEDTGCYGADPNRNWKYEWEDLSGSSQNPCSETYRGEDVFSEPETKTLSTYLVGLNEKDFMFYFCLHSYSQVLMIPYGLPNEEPEYLDELRTLGEGAVGALAKRNGTKYGFDKIYEAIGYKASGGSMDWVKKELKVRYTFEWELRDNGYYGFLLPASQIVDTAEETIDSMVYIITEAEKSDIRVGS